MTNALIFLLAMIVVIQHIALRKEKKRFKIIEKQMNLSDKISEQLWDQVIKKIEKKLDRGPVIM